MMFMWMMESIKMVMEIQTTMTLQRLLFLHSTSAQRSCVRPAVIPPESKTTAELAAVCIGFAGVLS